MGPFVSALREGAAQLRLLAFVEQLASAGWLPYLLRALSALFAIALTVVVWRLTWGGRGGGGRMSTLGIGFAAAFVLVLLYQATWQIGGFMRRPFVEFMQGHDPRPGAGAGRPMRGRIVSADNSLLAANKDGRRVYPHGEVFSHLVGYSHPVFGESGLERAASDFLYGQALDSSQDWERFGRRLFSERETPGNDLKLTIHAGLQAQLYSLFAGRRGAAVVLRPADGAILAAVSSPGFDPTFAQGRFPREKNGVAPMFNRALAGRYPPGSTFKVIMAALAIEAGFDGALDCPAAGFSPGGGVPPIRDYEYYVARRRGARWAGHGRLTLEEAFAKSSNTFFAQLGVRLRPERFAAGLDRFSFGVPVRLYEGSSGRIDAAAGAPADLPRGGNAAAVQTAIGQGGIEVSPLHLAMIMGAVANTGVVMMPRIDAGAPPRRVGAWFTPETARRLRAMLRLAVQRGTGRGANVEWLAIGGKTGTAQTGAGEDHSWFVSLAPADAPTLCMVAVLEHAGYGAEAALPLSVSAWKYMVEHRLFEDKVARHE